VWRVGVAPKLVGWGIFFLGEQLVLGPQIEKKITTLGNTYTGDDISAIYTRDDASALYTRDDAASPEANSDEQRALVVN